jgi:DNA-binding PadR family transcriptional regulator
MLVSWTGDPLPVRGGRARRYFRLTAAGANALEQARVAAEWFWQMPGLDLEPS